MISGHEGGAEFLPEPPPESTPETPPEAPPEAPPELAAEVAPEPGPKGSGDAGSALEPPPGAPPENMGEDAVLSEALAPEGGIDTAKAEEVAAAEVSNEMEERLSEAGVDAAGETVSTGNLSSNPEHAASELAAVRQHAEDRAAHLAKEAEASEAMEAKLDEDLALEADALEARWQERQAAEAADESQASEEQAEPVAEADPEALDRIAQETKRESELEAVARETDGHLKLEGIEDVAEHRNETAEFIRSMEPQELVEGSGPPQDIPLPHHSEAHPSGDPVTVLTLTGMLGLKKAGDLLKRS